MFLEHDTDALSYLGICMWHLPVKHQQKVPCFFSCQEVADILALSKELWKVLPGPLLAINSDIFGALVLLLY